MNRSYFGLIWVVLCELLREIADTDENGGVNQSSEFKDVKKLQKCSDFRLHKYIFIHC